MGSKIFLSKYRVSAEQIAAVGEPGERPVSYEAEEIDSGKKVQVEAISIAALKKEAREELEANAIAAKKLSHINIQSLADFGIQDQHLIYVRENVEGTTAEQWVKTHGPMPLGPVLRITSQVVSALGAAGFQRIVHRAINPSNLILVPGQTAEGEWPLVKVLHFEGAVPKPSGNGTGPDLEKSSQYASPEQLRYNVVDFRSEIYSLGATMWFLLTGEPPQMGPEGAVAASAKAGSPEEVTAMPEKLRHLLAKMLSINPSARPRDALAFYLQLQECLTELAPRELVSRTLGPPPKAAPREDELKGGRPFLIKAIALAVLLVAIIVPAALFLPGYFRNRQLNRPAQPIAARPVTPTVAATPKPVSTPASVSGPMVMLAPSASGTAQQPSASPLNVTLLSYTPMTGKPGGKDYKIATLTFRIEARSPVTVTEANFYVDSAPFTDGATRNQPITLLIHTGIFLGPPGTIVDPTHPIERTIWLKSQENLFPNWFAAYNQTENATFRWVIGGQPSGSAVKPLHLAWSTPRPTPEVRRAQPAKPE